MDTDAAVKLSVVILCGGKKITWKDDIRWLVLIRLTQPTPRYRAEASAHTDHLQDIMPS